MITVRAELVFVDEENDIHGPEAKSEDEENFKMFVFNRILAEQKRALRKKKRILKKYPRTR